MTSKNSFCFFLFYMRLNRASTELNLIFILMHSLQLTKPIIIIRIFFRSQIRVKSQCCMHPTVTYLHPKNYRFLLCKTTFFFVPDDLSLYTYFWSVIQCWESIWRFWKNRQQFVYIYILFLVKKNKKVPMWWTFSILIFEITIFFSILLKVTPVAW